MTAHKPLWRPAGIIACIRDIILFILVEIVEIRTGQRSHWLSSQEDLMYLAGRCVLLELSVARSIHSFWNSSLET